MAKDSQETPNPTTSTGGQATQRDLIDIIATRVFQSLIQLVTSLQSGLPESSKGSVGTALEIQGGMSSDISANEASGKPAKNAKGICFFKDKCKYRHICDNCGGRHPAKSCSHGAEVSLGGNLNFATLQKKQQKHDTKLLYHKLPSSHYRSLILFCIILHPLANSRWLEGSFYYITYNFITAKNDWLF